MTAPARVENAVAILAFAGNGSGSVIGQAVAQAHLLSRRGPVTLAAVASPSGARALAAALADTDVTLETVSEPVWARFVLRRFSHGPAEFLAARRLRRRLDTSARGDGGFQAVIAHSHSLLAHCAAPHVRRWGGRSILMVHGDIFERPAGTYERTHMAYLRLAARLAYRRADRVVANARNLAERVAHWRRNADPVVTLWPALDAADIGQADGEVLASGRSAARPDAQKEVLYVGRLTREKGVDVLVAAFARLIEGRAAQKRPAARLTIVGDGPEREALEAQAAALGIADKIRFDGHRERAVLAATFGRADVAAVPSRSEPFGLSAAEALICGVRLVASETGGLPEIVALAGQGETVPPEDPEALAAALGAALDAGPLSVEAIATTRRRLTALSRERYAAALAAIVDGEPWRAPPSKPPHDAWRPA